MIKRCFIVAAIGLSLFLFHAHKASGQSVRKGWGIPDGPLNCEMNFQNISYVRTLMGEQVNSDGVLILIARLGDGEGSRQLNRRRLYNVRLKLTTEVGIQKEKIIIAEGEQVKGFGWVEFYLAGQLVGALLVYQRDDICVGCCGPDDRFYPYKDKRKRKPPHRE